ncbi:MAG: hypothetical protein L0Z70_12460 [Chloroflexi bacterium]|nr:hypothetical protein [Chloroflexota bacterium]
MLPRRASALTAALIMLLATLLLAGCRGQSAAVTPTLTLAAATPTATAGYPPSEETIYPPPRPTQGGYPQPQQPEATSYPGGYIPPGKTPSVTRTFTPYPGPGGARPYVAPGKTPSATQTPGGYPEPVQPTSPTYPQPAATTPSSSYPGPQATSPTAYPGLAQPTSIPPGGAATATPLGAYPAPQGTPTPVAPPAVQVSATPTVTTTPAMVSARLEATSPQDFYPAAGKLQLVEFFAFWSPLSKSMAPVINGLEEIYGDRIGFVYLDIDDPANGIYKYLLGNRLPPVFLLLDGSGNVLHDWRGYVDVAEFEAAFASSTP